jgi:hypothetical protein
MYNEEIKAVTRNNVYIIAICFGFCGKPLSGKVKVHEEILFLYHPLEWCFSYSRDLNLIEHRSCNSGD